MRDVDQERAVAPREGGQGECVRGGQACDEEAVVGLVSGALPVPSPHAPRAECPRCRRPVVACYCAHVTSIPTRTRVLVLQHPRERDKAIGTARIAALCLPNAELVVGVDLGDDPRVRAALSDPTRQAVLLYPGAEGSAPPVAPAGPVTLVVVDGTWHHARTLLRENPWLRALPRYALSPPRPSEYRIRREPRADYVSTIEALAYTLGALEGEPERLQAILAPFRAMVETQLGYARVGHGRTRLRRRTPRAGRSRLPACLASPNLVCLAVEANAWPNDRKAGGPPFPHELVHVLAHRLADGTGFEQIVAPRLPLGPSAIAHARLTPEQLAAGCELGALHAVWSTFLRPDDVLCTWGMYGVGLLKRDGLQLNGEHVDLRKVAGDHLKARPGSAEDLVARLGLPWASAGLGRGGERLGMLTAVTRWLAAAATTAS